MQNIQITWDKNYNNKLGCDVLWHIDMPPKEELTQKKMDETIIEVSVADGSVEPQKLKVFGGWRIDLSKPIGNTLPMISHAMTEAEFVDHLFKKYPLRMGITTELYCYVYKKIKL